jgi:AraC-like DNA-binding protein
MEEKPLTQLLIQQARLQPCSEWTEKSGAWRFLLVSEGSAYWLQAGGSTLVATGDVLVVAPHARGVIRASALTEVLLHGFAFTPDLIGGFFTLGERHFFDTLKTKALGGVQFFTTGHPIAKGMSAAVSRPRPPGLLERIQLLGLVATVFDEESKPRRAVTSGRSLAFHHFEELIAELPDMDLIDREPEELAVFCECSVLQFRRLFRKRFGCSIREWQTKLRLIKACQLLCNKYESINSVAAASGYRSISLFDSQFESRFGMSPAAWRKHWGSVTLWRTPRETHDHYPRLRPQTAIRTN